MEDKDRKKFLLLMAMLGTNYNEEVTKEKAKLYYEYLKDYPIENVAKGIDRAIKEVKYKFPTIGILLDFIVPGRVIDQSYYPKFPSSDLPEIEYKRVDENGSRIHAILAELDRRQAQNEVERQERFQERRKILAEQKKLIDQISVQEQKAEILEITDANREGVNPGDTGGL